MSGPAPGGWDGYPPIECMTGEGQVLEACKSRLWRLNNLYWIVDANANEVLFRMRPAQRVFYDAHWYRNVILKARQLGFTTLIDLMILDAAIFFSNWRGRIIAHTRDDATRIFRDKIKFAYEHLPERLRRGKPLKDEAGELLLSNNSGVSVGTSGRSATLNALHVSEYGKICVKYPEKAKEIKTGALPAVHRSGFTFFESTAEGAAGDFYDLCQAARRRLEQGRPRGPLTTVFHFFPWYENPECSITPDTVLIPERLGKYFGELEQKLKVKISAEQRAWYTETECGEMGLGSDMRREYPSTPDEAFEQAIEGAYYERQLNAAYADGRVGSYPHMPEAPVSIAIDIGHRDAMAVWAWHDFGYVRRYIRYYEASGEDLAHLAEVLARWRDEYGYRYGAFWAPNDIKVTEWGGGMTRLERAWVNYGLDFRLVPSVSFADGVDRARREFGRYTFDEVGCADGLKALNAYRKKWDKANGLWLGEPVHDWSSHGADAFRYSALTTDPGSGVARGVKLGAACGRGAR